MRISVSREELKAALDVCAKVVSLKARREALRCVRIEAGNGKIAVSATNLEEWLTAPLESAAVQQEGSCLANLAELRLFVKDAQPKRHIELESDDVAVKATTDIGGSSIARGIKTADISDWPEFPKEPASLLKASASFLETIRQAAPSTSSKDFRRALACVYVEAGLAVATDGHHLVALPCKSPFETALLLKPSKALDSLKGDCLAGLDKPEKGAARLHVRCAGVNYATTLGDAQYPNWRQVVPDEKGLPLCARFDAKNAAELLRAIPALKSPEGALALRCSKDGVMAGSSFEVAAFKTGALYSGATPFDIELSAANLRRAVELELYEMRMTNAFSPVLFKSQAGGFMASMPLRQKKSGNPTQKTEERDMNKQETTNSKAQEPASKTNGFSVVESLRNEPTPVDPFDELLKSAEDVKTAARSSYEAAALFAKKLRDAQCAIKRKERERKSTRELIEKLKQASGF